MVVIVIYIFIILAFSLFSDIDVFDSFVKGSKETYKQLPGLFVNILAIIFSINVFIKSGIVDFIFDLLKINMVSTNTSQKKSVYWPYYPLADLSY